MPRRNTITGTRRLEAPKLDAAAKKPDHSARGRNEYVQIMKGCGCRTTGRSLGLYLNLYFTQHGRTAVRYALSTLSLICLTAFALGQSLQDL
jgi:hypothetical protein